MMVRIHIAVFHVSAIWLMQCVFRAIMDTYILLGVAEFGCAIRRWFEPRVLQEHVKVLSSGP
jgi:hypothetical protein